MLIACGSAWRVAPRPCPRLTHVGQPWGDPPGASTCDEHRGSFALGTGRSPMRKPHVPCVWNRLVGRPTAGAGPSPPTSRRCIQVEGPVVGDRTVGCAVDHSQSTGRSPRRKPHAHCMWNRLAGRPTADPRLVQAHVHPAGSAVTSRPFVSAGPFCRGSFALGTGRSPRRKPHGHCM